MQMSAYNQTFPASLSSFVHIWLNQPSSIHGHVKYEKLEDTSAASGRDGGRTRPQSAHLWLFITP